MSKCIGVRAVNVDDGSVFIGILGKRTIDSDDDEEHGAADCTKSTTMTDCGVASRLDSSWRSWRRQRGFVSVQ